MRAPGAAAVWTALMMAGGLAVGATTAGCGQPCCTYDSLPIRLERAPEGELLALVSDTMPRMGRRVLLDTGSSVTLWNGAFPQGGPEVERRDLELLGATDNGAAPVRAILRGVNTIATELGALSGVPGELAGVFGGDLLTGFSVEIGFAAPQLTLWERQPANDGFLSAAGYAVLRVNRWGAGETNAKGPSDGIGPRGPYQYPPSLLVLRACAAPEGFTPEAPPLERCCPGDERQRATGADLSLLLGTGTGPIVLARSAWERVRTKLIAVPGAVAPVLVPGFLHIASAREPLKAEWTRLPRLALVDREADPAANPGACVELGRARRLEQVAWRQARNAIQAACALPCDLDPRSEGGGYAYNSAGYLELSGELPVAVVDDGATLLQTVRAEVRPEGPEVDGIIGAGALRNAHVELDYRSQPARAIFSCEKEAGAGSCRAVGRCPRLPAPGQTHACFGLPPHGLPGMCDNTAACE